MNKKPYTFRTLLKLVSLLSFVFIFSIQAQTQPNIILVIADDLSWDDLGAYGHETVKTPNLDKMAEKGMKFDNAYLTASSCSPSRSSIITGRYPHNTDAEQLHWALPAAQITFSEKLQEVGYWTAAAGKWHLGDEVVDRFDVVHESRFGKDEPSGTDKWLGLLDERPKDKPFFLWLASWDAHRPFFEGEHPVKYAQEDVRMPPYYPATELYLNDFAAYYNEVSRLDYVVGQIVKKLESQGIADNTLIVFIADNGRPYARDKATLYDSGVKTPFIAYWPDGISAGIVSKSIISSIDIAPTFLTLANAELPSTLEGKTLTPLFKAPNTPFRKYAFSERNWHDFEDHGRSVRSEKYRYIRNNYNDLPATPSADTVYHKTWAELVRLNKQGALTNAQSRPFLAPRPKEELYDLTSDPYELNNLASNKEYSNILMEHSEALEQWIKQTNDFIPSFRTHDDFDRETGAITKYRKRNPRPSKMEMYNASGKY
ncbi:sulfatase [Aliiglaciecola sp. 3_MG-2023]|uniref:sulfatase family protein n=1 Tax=Aliiglaciecola sp. 3_MG-2023 TaxID=3062644 RepID=UPI0026E32B90|nr:sulfatase [Aliiglaciecola sp. 3_MG-2023]MDO6693897.1 sulfatase [Aliiglaciecola sp. 3_MG-2023]